MSKYNKEYYEKNKDRILEVNRNCRKRNYIPHPRQITKPKNFSYTYKRNKFLEMYGGRCSCCGETIKEFLTIEHILGQKGKKRETSFKAYELAIKEYQPEVYEILCYNCNCSKGKYGKCPHKSTWKEMWR